MEIPPWAPVLTDDVVTLRPHHPDDVEEVVVQCRDPLTRQWTTVPSPYERRDAVAWLDDREPEWTSGRRLSFAVQTQGRFAGSVNLRPDGAGAADVGYGLAPWARGRGVMTRALRLLLSWGFATLGLEVVHWSAAVGNWPSRRAAWSVGFRIEGTVRGLLPDRGHRADGWIGSLRRSDLLVPSQPWLEPVVLDGGDVVLRPHLAMDAERMAEACADGLTQRWLPDLPSPYTIDNARGHLEEIAEHHASGQCLYWAVTEPDSDLLQGEVGLFGLGAIPAHTGELGYWAHPQGRGRGLMTGAVRLVARHTLLPDEDGGLGLPRLLVRAASRNLASQRVARAAGFRPAGADRKAELLRNGMRDDLLRFDLLAEELPYAESTSWPRSTVRRLPSSLVTEKESGEKESDHGGDHGTSGDHGISGDRNGPAVPVRGRRSTGARAGNLNRPTGPRGDQGHQR